MNIKDLPQGSYTPVTPTSTPRLNIKDLPQGSYTPVSASQTPSSYKQGSVVQDFAKAVVDPLTKAGTSISKAMLPKALEPKYTQGGSVPSVFGGKDVDLVGYRDGQKLQGKELAKDIGGTALEVASYAPIARGAAIVQKGIGGAAAKVGQLAKEFGVAGALQGAGSEYQKGGTTGEALSQGLTTGAISTVAGPIIGKGAELAGRAGSSMVKKATDPVKYYTDSAKANALKAVNVIGGVKPADMSKIKDKAYRALSVIKKVNPEIKRGEIDVPLDIKNSDTPYLDVNDALVQTRKRVYEGIRDAYKEATGQSLRINPSPILDELRSIYNNTANAVEKRSAAQGLRNELLGMTDKDGNIPIENIETFTPQLNTRARPGFGNSSALSAQLNKDFSIKLSDFVDDAVEKIGIPQLRDLKDDYSSLKAIEKYILNEAKKEARRLDTSIAANIGDVGSAEILSGIVNAFRAAGGDAQAAGSLARGVALKAFSKMRQAAGDRANYLRKAFDDIDEINRQGVREVPVAAPKPVETKKKVDSLPPVPSLPRKTTSSLNDVPTIEDIRLAEDFLNSQPNATIEADQIKAKELLSGLNAQLEALDSMDSMKALGKFVGKRGEFKGELNLNNGSGKFGREGDTILREAVPGSQGKSAEELAGKYSSWASSKQAIKENMDSLKKFLRQSPRGFVDLNAEIFPKKPTALKNPLLEEAKKYKSAEEFVKAQGETAYHGTKQQFDAFSSEKLGSNTGAKSSKEGFFFTDNIENANHYTKKVIDTENYDVAKKIMEDGRFRFRNHFSSKTIGTGKNISALDFGNKPLTKENILKVASDNFDNEIASTRQEITEFVPKYLQQENFTQLDKIVKNKPSYMKIWKDNVSNISTNAPEIKDVILDYKKPFIVKASESNFGSGNLGGAKFTDVNGKVHTGYADTIKYAKENGYDAVIMKNVKDPIKANNTIVFSPDQIKTKSQLTDIWNKAKGTTKSALPVYKGETDLTTKILKSLEGKSTVSKQFILDATNRGELKQVERDLIRKLVADEPNTVDVAKFANKVKAELLPLERKAVGEGKNLSKYESISLPDDLRGNVKNYTENIYASPIKTSAGNVHFGGSKAGENYFGHTRIEDMADNQTRRVIEVQSDLYQKGGLEKELPVTGSESRFLDGADAQRLRYINGRMQDMEHAVNGKDYLDEYRQLKKEAEGLRAKNNAKEAEEFGNRKKEIAPLEQYNDPTAHFRMIREEIKKAAEDGKTKLQFPTGETAMKIEGLGSTNQWGDRELSNRLVDENPSIGLSRLQREARLTPENLKVGKEVNDGGTDWIITDVLGDGKFKAVQKKFVDLGAKNWEITLDKSLVKDGGNEAWSAYNKATGDREFQEFTPANKEKALEFLKSKFNGEDDLTKLGERYGEEFDISGKVDQNNPIYKFYNKEVRNYLNKFGGKEIKDDKGVSWIEIPIGKNSKGAVEAFGLLGAVGLGAAASGNQQANAMSTQDMPLLGSPQEDNQEAFMRPNEAYLRKPASTYSVRKNLSVSEDELKELAAVLFGEVGNRPLDKKLTELRAITNIALNRAEKEGKTLKEVLQSPNQFQAYLGKQYNSYKSGKASNSVLEKEKIKAVEAVIDEIRKGKLKNTVGDNLSYAHLKDDTLRLYKDWSEQKKDLKNIK